MNKGFANRNVLCMWKCWRKRGLEIWLFLRLYSYKLLKLVGPLSGIIILFFSVVRKQPQAMRCISLACNHKTVLEKRERCPLLISWKSSLKRHSIQKHIWNLLRKHIERISLFQKTEKIEHFFSIHINPCRYMVFSPFSWIHKWYSKSVTRYLTHKRD